MHPGGQCFSSYTESVCTPTTSTTPRPTVGAREVRGRTLQTNGVQLSSSVRASVRPVAPVPVPVQRCSETLTCCPGGHRLNMSMLLTVSLSVGVCPGECVSQVAVFVCVCVCVCVVFWIECLHAQNRYLLCAICSVDLVSPLMIRWNYIILKGWCVFRELFIELFSLSTAHTINSKPWTDMGLLLNCESCCFSKPVHATHSPALNN